MYKVLLFSSFLIFNFTSYSFAKNVDPFDSPLFLKNRQVIGVICFQGKSSQLSKKQIDEIEQIVNSVDKNFSANKVLRVEGFSRYCMEGDDTLQLSLSRAKSVWLYLVNQKMLDRHNLYMTGFTEDQTFSNLRGDRVEIVIYEDPFKGKLSIND